MEGFVALSRKVNKGNDLQHYWDEMQTNRMAQL